jgi:hypothetical protein
MIKDIAAPRVLLEQDTASEIDDEHHRASGAVIKLFHRIHFTQHFGRTELGERSAWQRSKALPQWSGAAAPRSIRIACWLLPAAERKRKRRWLAPRRRWGESRAWDFAPHAKCCCFPVFLPSSSSFSYTQRLKGISRIGSA